MEGADGAEAASRVLEEAWPPPALRYSPEYLRWQLSFPSPLPAVMAFDGGEPAGFAGVTARRLRHGSLQWDSGIVSFVGVRPQWRNRGVAAELYRRLLGALRDQTLVTFAEAGSGGERSLARAYPEAGFQMQPLGTYPIHTGMPRGEPEPDWEVTVSEDARELGGIVEACAADGSLIWSDPSAAQIAHYLGDPRPRKLLLAGQRGKGAVGAAWAVRSEYRTARGVEQVTALESLFLPREHGRALAVLLRRAAGLWSAGGPAVVSLPSLYGFDAAALRLCGIRRTGTVFQGRLCARELPEAARLAQGTNLEVV